MRSFTRCLLLLLFSVSIAAQTQRVRVISERANLRSVPSITGEILIEVPKDSQFEVLRIEGAWYLVQTSKFVGWLHGNALELVQSAPRPASASQTKQKGYQPVFPEEDVGVDLAIVTAYNTSLMNGERVISRLRQGQFLALVERTSKDGWYSVIDIDSSSAGYVSEKDIEIRFSKNRKSGALFEKLYTGNESNPKLKIINGTNRVIYLNLNETRYELKPRDELNFTFPPGSIKYYAATPGVLPDFGNELLSKGYVYSWEFYIITK